MKTIIKTVILLLGMGSFISAKAQVSLSASAGTLSASYPTLNAAFAAINAGTHQGAINISVTGNTTEPSPPTSLVGNGIGSANYSSINISPIGGSWTINSSAVPFAFRGIIELFGAKHVTIDGDPTGTGVQHLTFKMMKNTNIETSVIRLGSIDTSGATGASFDTIRNCNIIGGLDSVISAITGYGILVSGSNNSSTTTHPAYSCDNNSFINNNMFRCYYAMYLNGPAYHGGFGNKNTLIKTCHFGSSNMDSSILYGIYMQYFHYNDSLRDYINIDSNSFTANSTNSLTCIYNFNNTCALSITNNNFNNISANVVTGIHSTYVDQIGVLSISNNNFSNINAQGQVLAISTSSGFASYTRLYKKNVNYLNNTLQNCYSTAGSIGLVDHNGYYDSVRASHNQITNITNGAGSSAFIQAIQISDHLGAFVCDHNLIRNITVTSESLIGIIASAPRGELDNNIIDSLVNLSNSVVGHNSVGITAYGHINIYNNFIGDLSAIINVSSPNQAYTTIGIILDSGRCVHNTIALNMSALAGSDTFGFSSCIFNVGVGSFVTNNIIANTQYSTNADGYYINSNYSTDTSDYNDYYVPFGNVGYATIARHSLLDWQAALSQDLHSGNAIIPFRTVHDLHIDSANASFVNVYRNGNYLTAYSVDIDNQPRNNPPCIGADEFGAVVNHNVLIPDTNFGTWLNANGYSSCMTGNNATGWYMDTTCGAVQAATSLTCRASNIHDLTGIQYFKNLNWLDCDSNNLNSLSLLPASITYLDISSNHFSIAPTLPANLLYFYCGAMNSASLPGALPTTLPNGLLVLACQGNHLTSLPPLPSSLFSLSCFKNQIVSLPLLPNGLKQLVCSYNPLTSLPALPDSLSELYCSYNLLTSIPTVPRPITKLLCNHNLNLSCLPQVLSNNLAAFYIDSTNIQCMPNHFTATDYDIRPDSLPICGIGNANGCQIYNYVLIPDTNFGTWLNTHNYSSCMAGSNTSGWYMDTICSAMQPDTIMYCDSANIYNLTGVCYLKNIHNIHCSLNHLSTLPRLPDNLTYLMCVYNEITNIPALPDSLVYFYCTFNRLTSLPALPPHLAYLTCNYNHLTSLPAMPSSLYELQCDSNQLSSLPALAHTSLSTLSCRWNALSSIPTLPAHLSSLVCGDNPTLSCLPYMSQGNLNTFIIAGTNIQCMPNRLTATIYDIRPDSLPICGVGNTNGCHVYNLSAGPDQTVCSHATATMAGSGSGTWYAANGNPSSHLVFANDTLPGTMVSGFDSIGTYIILFVDTTTPAFDIMLIHVTNCVWPGDANSDHLVDNTDLLPIGLAYDSAGPARTVQTIVWQGDIATDWTDTLPGGINYKYADCNGNGIVNADDTLAIVTNFALSHAKTHGTPGIWRSGLAGITLRFSSDTVVLGDILTTTVILGDSNTLASGIYGLAFTFNYDPDIYDSTTTGFQFINSWFGNGNNSISISKDFHSAGQVKAAITGINHMSRSGNGDIANYRGLITTDNINGKDLRYYQNHNFISDITAIDQHGYPVPLNAGKDSNAVGYEPSSIRGIKSVSRLKVYPNPARDRIKVIADAAIERIEIIDIVGNLISLQPGKNSVETIDISHLAAGVYVVRVSCAGTIAQAKLMVNR